MLCPRCARDCDEVGTADVGGQAIPVWQCPRCVVRSSLLGVACDVSLTFAVSPEDGRVFDPRTSETIDPEKN